MTLRSLQIFAAVAGLGKMSSAAEKLRISQPTISQAISELEKEYNIKLFERLSKKLFLTDTGRSFLRYAMTILDTADELEKEMKYLSQHKTVNFGATLTVGASVLPAIVDAFENMYAKTTVNVFVDNTSVIETRLSSGLLDLALIEGKSMNPDMITIPAMKDTLILVCSPKFPFAKRQEIQLRELENQPFILREEGSGTRAVFDEKMRQNNIKVTPKWVCHSFDSILEAVTAGQGLTVISRRLVTGQIAEGKLSEVSITDAQFVRTFDLIYHKTKYISDTLRALIDLVKAMESV